MLWFWSFLVGGQLWFVVEPNRSALFANDEVVRWRTCNRWRLANIESLLWLVVRSYSTIFTIDLISVAPEVVLKISTTMPQNQYGSAHIVPWISIQCKHQYWRCFVRVCLRANICAEFCPEAVKEENERSRLLNKSDLLSKGRLRTIYSVKCWQLDGERTKEENGCSIDCLTKDIVLSMFKGHHALSLTQACTATGSALDLESQKWSSTFLWPLCLCVHDSLLIVIGRGCERECPTVRFTNKSAFETIFSTISHALAHESHI